MTFHRRSVDIESTSQHARSNVIIYDDRSILLKRRKGGKNPTSLVFFDCESTNATKGIPTETVNQRLRLGVARALRLSNGRPTRCDKCYFSKKQDFWEFINKRLRQQNSLWIFAHNLGYDATLVGLWDQLTSSKLLLKNPKRRERKGGKEQENRTKFDGILCDDDPPNFVICWDQEGRRLCFVDTFNYFKSSIADLGKQLGLPKIEIDTFNLPDEELFKYCDRDCEIVELAIVRLMNWFSSHNFGSFKLTAPSLAMEAFRSRFYTTNIVTHMEPNIRKLERAAYYGGRLELFRQGKIKRKVYALDVQSMYPFVMRERQYPIRLLTDSERSGIKISVGEIDDSYIAEVLIDTKTETFPLRIDGVGMCFPLGSYWTTLCGPELIRAKQAKTIKEIGKWSKYKLGLVFDKFIDEFWTLRKSYKEQGNELYNTFTKLLMNSLYGKFGIKTGPWETIGFDRFFPEHYRTTIYNVSQETKSDLRCVLGYIQERVQDREHIESFPAIAAYVTSWAREYLLEAMKIAGLENVYYVVTDSIYTNQIGYNNLREANKIKVNELGKFTIEAEASEANFESIHWFLCGERIKQGSRKRSASPNPDGSVTEIRFEGVKSIITRGPTDYVKVGPVVKRFERTYRKGIVHPNGIITPLIVRTQSHLSESPR